jgi:four helix bundle protein
MIKDISKKYDLEGRTLKFSKETRDFIKSLPKSLSNYEYSKQLIRSSSSIGANYIEANDALSKKDFILHIKIARKEAKESIYWFQLLEAVNENERQRLSKEATELMKIMSSIMIKSQIA